jgi:hypothetical protein
VCQVGHCLRLNCRVIREKLNRLQVILILRSKYEVTGSSVISCDVSMSSGLPGNQSSISRCDKKVFFQIKVTKGWRKPAPIWVHYTTSCNTQSNTPEDGRDQRPKHVELIGIINKPLLLHLVGVYIIFKYLRVVDSDRLKIIW